MDHMGDFENLVKEFARVGLSLKEWQRDGGAIFAMDIRDGKFRIQMGRDNNVRVHAKDVRMNQLLLYVQEQARDFTERISPSDVRPRDRIVGRGERHVTVLRRTQEEKRHYLCGLDERGHPFIAEIPYPVTTVRRAHEALKPDLLRGKPVRGRGRNYRKRRAKTYRQGEWFFTPATKEEAAVLAEAEDLVERKVGLGTAWARILGLRRDRVPARRNPHVADEALVFAERWPDGLPYRCVFVRGAVRHDEHRTLRFPHWMRVVPNAEPGAKRGVKWID